MKKNKSKHKNAKTQQSSQSPGAAAPVASVAGFSRFGKKLLLAGAGIGIVGFYLLTKTDPAGQNWASHVSPFLILGGYVLIGFGIASPVRPADPAKEQA